MSKEFKQECIEYRDYIEGAEECWCRSGSCSPVPHCPSPCPPGAVGPQGPQGPQGAVGEIGPQGPRGSRGENGEPGLQGPRGLQGIAGPQGARGVKGDHGPRGCDGQTGERGPRGQQGPAGMNGTNGISATVEIGTVEVGGCDEASVSNSGTTSAAVLDFVLPQANGIEAFGGAYHNRETTLHLHHDEAHKIPFNVAMPMRNMCEHNDVIRLEKCGVYQISYLLSGTASSDCEIAFAVRSCGHKLPSTDIVHSIRSGRTFTCTCCAIVRLNKGDYVELIAESEHNVDVRLADCVNATITLMKLD